jgi:hypothetical protein
MQTDFDKLPDDSTAQSDSAKLDIDSLMQTYYANIGVTLPEAGRWVSLFYNRPGSNAIVVAQDNGRNDFDNNAGKVILHLNGDIFPEKGNYTLYIIASNYPIQRFSQNFLTQKSIQLKIY